MKDLGELKYFLGIEFARSKQGILMHQRKYAHELISETGMSASKPAITPIDIHMKFTTKEYDNLINSQDSSKSSTPDQSSKSSIDDPLTDQGAYQRLVGKLLYLTITRLDISYGVQTLSQFLQQPKKSHMEAALRIVRYIKGQPDQGILLSSDQNTTITAFCDAD
ncbi:uncharacterized mitochondrial protein AtMg00810-like [Lycium ferocissimum]|uniref:uncharacterized mitochondrial protein AtMg00810-like n=1 Tax=Lycium ferocissimum TaxID=112874 RepID=UPI0028155C5B|nr:uncharacterized mitochondrial protein AtMg00810-like [Lycium ferocissimum]